MLPPSVHQLFVSHGPLRTHELAERGVARVQLSRWVKEGSLQRLTRGLYALPDYAPDEYASLIEVATRAPQVVFCLLTALRFHNLTTQSPFEVWIAIGNKDHPPRIASPRLRVTRFSPDSLAYGVEAHRASGTVIQVTSIAKTVADCFKFRGKVGLDVALEALRETVQDKHASVDAIWEAARVCRVQRVMRPYLESLP